MSGPFSGLEIELEIRGETVGRGAEMSGIVGKTPGYARYSGYDTEEQEDEYLSVLGPVWCDGDPMPVDDDVNAKRGKPNALLGPRCSRHMG
jgi:hypothetical protein